MSTATDTLQTAPQNSANGSKAPEPPVYSPWRESWRRFRRHKLAHMSLYVLAVMILAILFGPFIWRVPINEIDFTARLAGPSWAHPLGTDDLGQDLLARMLYGA